MQEYLQGYLRKRTVGIVGCGALGSLVARGIASGKAGPFAVASLLDVPHPERAQALSVETGARACGLLDEFLGTRPDYVVEAAGGQALKEIAVKCLLGGSNLVCLSSGAFVDEEFLATVTSAAERAGRKVHVASGAIGGFDLGGAALLAGNLDVTSVNEKPPQALQGAPALANTTLSPTQRQMVFGGSALEAVPGFPQNLNVVASLALGTVGLRKLRVEVYSDPSLCANRHTVKWEGIFGTATLTVQSFPTSENPKSSALAAYSVLSLLKRIASPVEIG